MSKQDELLAPAPSGACAPMSDAEVICSWMEPRPPLPAAWCPGGWPSQLGWWWLMATPGGGMAWTPWRNGRPPALDALWEVEERLKREYPARHIRTPYSRYRDRLEEIVGEDDIFHATPEQKRKALAAVLRPLVTGARGADATRASNKGDLRERLENG